MKTHAALVAEAAPIRVAATKRLYEKPVVRRLSRAEVWRRRARAAWCDLWLRVFCWLLCRAAFSRK